jgi:hypothetical protein
MVDILAVAAQLRKGIAIGGSQGAAPYGLFE